jgi:hypothetical protein
MTSVLRTAQRYLRTAFEAYDHHPTHQQLNALDGLLRHLQKMADGKLEPSYFVSSLDPGVGKTAVVKAYLKALTENPADRSVGVILGLFRRSEIADLVDTCDLPRQAFAIFTSEERLNSLGSPDRESAQVLFTTQQRIALLTRNRAFADTGAFLYQGHPRRVRIWDESFRPALPIALSRDELLACLVSLRSQFPGQAQGLDDFLQDIGNRNDGKVITVPSMESMFGVDLETVLNERRAITLKERDLLYTLMLAGGKAAIVRKAATHRPHMLVTATEVFPRDLAPLVVLDASARVKHDYRLWRSHRGTLRNLGRASKRYEGLKIHYWRRGGGRSTVQADPEPYRSHIVSDRQRNLNLLDLKMVGSDSTTQIGRRGHSGANPDQTATAGTQESILHPLGPTHGHECLCRPYPRHAPRGPLP